jgi:60 kDa SS-A/Ro ribonucleoprotein
MRCIAQRRAARRSREIVAVSERGPRAEERPGDLRARARRRARRREDAPRRARRAPRRLPHRHAPVPLREYVEQFRGWGRGLRRAVGAWYQREDVDALAYQAVKYRQRDGWTHRDLLRLAHPSRPRPSTTRSTVDRRQARRLRSRDRGRLRARAGRADAAETVAVIREYPDLPREALNPEHLTDPDVWDALLAQGMPMTALMRNLATMSRIGLLTPMSDAERIVLEQLGDAERLRKARVHPLAVLVALKTYEQGYSDRSGQTVDAAPRVVDALDGAFYAAFGNVEPTGKRTMLALDVSGSMGFSQIAGMPGITPRVGSRRWRSSPRDVEPQHMFTAFATQFVGLTISRASASTTSCADRGLPFGGTDCALPMLAAEQNDIEIDTFVIYTDSETWAGQHPPVAGARALPPEDRHPGQARRRRHGVQRLHHRGPERPGHARRRRLRHGDAAGDIIGGFIGGTFSSGLADVIADV